MPTRSDVEGPDGAARIDVSVLVPSYNSSPYIVAAIHSALAQEGAEIEVLVQDAGSTDGSLESLIALADPRLRCTSEPDDGQSDALNRALQRASGEFVMWLNADDLLVEGAVATLLCAARDRSLDVVHGAHDIIDTNGVIVKSYSSAPLERERLMRHGAYIFSGTLLIRRRLLLDVGGFDADLHYCMDYDLLLRLAEAHRSAGSVLRVVAQFRRQPSSKSESWLKSGSTWLPFLRERLAVKRRYGATVAQNLTTVVLYVALKALGPIRRSQPWVRMRPHKHLGGT